MSTLKPGKVPPYIKKLRAAALKEMAATPEGEEKAKKVEFDHDHKKSPVPETDDFDAENGVAKYPGQNSPHVGNGTGGVR